MAFATSEWLGTATFTVSERLLTGCPSQAVACLLLNNPVLSYRVDAGKVELDGAQYLGFRIPLTISQLVWIEAILVGGAEVYRNRERDPETRLYPGMPAALAHPCPG